MDFDKIEKQRLLFNAGRKNDPAGMEELLKEGTDIISRRHNRRSSDCSRSLSSLINARNKDGLTLPMELAYCLTPEVLECFIRNGGDTAARDEYGAQALMHFALRNHATSSPETIREIIRLFTESGVDVNARDFDGKTALIHCIIGNHKKELVRALMEAGADINAGDRNGWTPVMYAVQFEDCWVKDGFLEFLVRDCGADINARDHNGWTPLIHAAHRNRLIPNLFDQLIALGADPYIKSLKTGPSGREEGFASSINSTSLLYYLYTHITGLGDRKLQEAVFIETLTNISIPVYKQMSIALLTLAAIYPDRDDFAADFLRINGEGRRFGEFFRNSMDILTLSIPPENRIWAGIFACAAPFGQSLPCDLGLQESRVPMLISALRCAALKDREAVFAFASGFLGNGELWQWEQEGIPGAGELLNILLTSRMAEELGAGAPGEGGCQVL